MDAIPVLHDPENSDAWCPRCQGYGEETILVGGGPDAYDQTVNCQHCDGHGTLYHAYKGLERSLGGMHKAYLEACAKLYVAPTAEQVRALEAERDALRNDRRAFAIKVGHEISSWIDANDPMPDVERIVDAIAAKEPA